MIELAIRTALMNITGLKVYPLLLPVDQQEGITYQRISDPIIEVGLVRTQLVSARFQITLYLINDYTRLVQLERAIWEEWKWVVHSDVEGYPVQSISRGGIKEGEERLTDGSTRYSRIRDFIFVFAE